jgi:phosphate transport system permease protein
MRRFFETIVEKILFASGTITSIAILMIILFLFRQGAGLFDSPVVEDGYSLITNNTNIIDHLTPEEIKNIFDEEIINWGQVGGTNQEIIVFRLSDITKYVSEDELGDEYQYVPQAISRIISENTAMIGFVPSLYIEDGFQGKILDLGNIEISDYFLGKEWFPTAQPAPLFGIKPLILGTLWVSLAAILLALPFGIAVSVYMAELASPRVRNLLKPIIELLAGIPSVVYGFFGLVVIVPLIQKLFDLPVGETGLAGAIILSIMALPTIISVAEDSLRTVPLSTKEASLALGASHMQTIFRVTIPYCISGIMAAVVLGIGRAIGETMAVLMVTGNSAVIPTTLLEPVRTIPATIAAELGEAPNGGAHYEALFMLGAILFIITLIISITVELISAKQHKQQM